MISRRIKRAVQLVAQGRLVELREKLRDRLDNRLYSTRTDLGLRRDLQVPFVAPQAKIPIAVREQRRDDVPALFDEPGRDLSRQEQGELSWRREVVELDISRCFVAVDQRTGTPCYMQWLIGPDQNGRIPEIGSFPQLRPDEGLLENAYTPVPYRGLGIMPAAMALISERAADYGLHYVMTFVAHDNVASLKGCERAGFSPQLIRRRTQHCFNVGCSVSFVPLSKASVVSPNLASRGVAIGGC